MDMAYATATTIAVDDIPVIDVAALAGSDPASRLHVATAMREAAERIGFFYVRNHGVPSALIAQVFATSAAFFALPPEIKSGVTIDALHRGWLAVGQAKMYAGAKIDLKESFLWGLELGADDPDVIAGKKLMGPNHWPDFMPEMRDVLSRYYDEILACGRRLLSGLALSLDPIQLPADEVTGAAGGPAASAELLDRDRSARGRRRELHHQVSGTGDRAVERQRIALQHQERTGAGDRAKREVAAGQERAVADGLGRREAGETQPEQHQRVADAVAVVAGADRDAAEAQVDVANGLHQDRPGIERGAAAAGADVAARAHQQRRRVDVATDGQAGRLLGSQRTGLVA